MKAVRAPDTPSPDRASPFDPHDERAYRRWREGKLAARPRSAGDLTVDLDDPRALRAAERDALSRLVGRHNMAIYRSKERCGARDAAQALGRQLGLHRLDANWLADEDGISSITVSARSDGRGGFIPYTDRALHWHTDGYYHPPQRRIRAMVLHCVRPARAGGANALVDHELVYLALRDAHPAALRALMAPDAMTIPAREDDGGVKRPAQAGPVFWTDDDGALQMRYTARTRSIVWKDDAATRAGVAFVEGFLASDAPGIVRLRLEAGMGIVAHNVPHERSAFVDDPAAPRLIYRARYLDRVATTSPADDALTAEAAWRNG